MEPASDHVTPNQEMIDLFDSWDTTKTKSKLKSFNRAKSWFCRLLKCPFPGLPKGHHMRREDKDNAFQLVLEAYSSGLSFEDYIKSGLQGTIVVESENVSNLASSDDEGSEDVFSDAPEIIIEETRVAAATKHCEPDCSQCKEASETTVTAGGAGVASAPDGAAVIGEAAAAGVQKRPPVCHFLWLAKDCTVVGCQKSHPTLCTNPRCLELDQDLPRWKSAGCKKWHGRTKTSNPKPHTAKKSMGNPRKVPSQKSRTFHGSRPQTMGPMGLLAPWLQTWDQSKPHSPQETDQWNQVKMGNDQAARTPLTRVGTNQWGNGRMPYNVAAKGPNPAEPFQFELDLIALVNRVLV
jgi:hypothetical protein